MTFDFGFQNVRFLTGFEEAPEDVPGHRCDVEAPIVNCDPVFRCILPYDHVGTHEWRGKNGSVVRWDAAPVPEGLCGNKNDHEPHVVPRAAVAGGGSFWCHADQKKRLPFALDPRILRGQPCEQKDE